MIRPSCQCFFTEFLSANHAPAKKSVELFGAQAKIIEPVDCHKPALMQAFSDEKKSGPIKADRLQKLSAL
jgi:hypothetical protein